VRAVARFHSKTFTRDPELPMSRRMAKSFWSLTSTFFTFLIAVSGLVSGTLLQEKKATRPNRSRRNALDHQREDLFFQCEGREGIKKGDDER